MLLIIGLILVGAGGGFPVVNLWRRLSKAQGTALLRWVGIWAVKGLIGPFLVWMVFNSCFTDAFPPLIIEIQAAPRGWPTVEVFLFAAAFGFCIIGSYWAALTLGWWLQAMAEQAADRAEFRRVVLGFSLFLLPLAALIVWAFGGNSVGVAGVVWLGPIAQAVIPLAFPEKTAPTYSRAMIKMLGGKYAEAETAVIEELEKAEDDFKGWLMLAELYAHHFDDLAGAGRIIRETCAQAGTTVSEGCVAFNHLADWHLKLADDPVGARSALEEICGRFPETHMARMA